MIKILSRNSTLEQKQVVYVIWEVSPVASKYTHIVHGHALLLRYLTIHSLSLTQSELLTASSA